MKKIYLSVSLLFCGLVSNAQNGIEYGLQDIIVEKYYISELNDAAANLTDGVLPVSSTTYRIYADMLPGYKFQAAFGVPTHELRIETTTLFFNNEDRGSTSPTFTKTQAKSNTVMLDSWLSVGAACSGNFGVLKTEDDGLNTNVNNDGLLQNNDPAAGIPLTDEDGFRAGTPQSVTTLGIDAEIAMFDAQNDGTNGPVFSTWNGSWASLNGSYAVGVDSLDNRILIAQITTDGDFSFQLNIQIGTPSGGVQQYVAQNPVDPEILLASLTYNASSSVGINNPVAANSLVSVYPNPAKEQVTIAVSNTNSINNYYAVYDGKGSLLAQNTIEEITAKHNETVDISTYPKGLYFVVVSLDGTVTSHKIIKN